jgi:hypothetical protein
LETRHPLLKGARQFALSLVSAISKGVRFSFRIQIQFLYYPQDSIVFEGEFKTVEGVAAKVIADILAIDERTVRKYAAAGTVVRVGHGKYALRESIRNYVKVLREAGPGARPLSTILSLALKSDGLDFTFSRDLTR